MRKALAFVAAAAIYGTLSADGYQYQIKDPVPTVSYPAASGVETLVFGGRASGAALSQEQTSFAGWTCSASVASALDARKPVGAMLLIR